MKTKEMTEDELKALKSDTCDMLAVARQKLLMKFPFTGGVIMKLNIVPVRDFRLSTACTDGSNVFVDIGFYTGLNEEEREFVLGHETWHCILMHMARLQHRDHLLFNIATDIEVNRLLTAEGLKAPAHCLMPTNEDEQKMSAEEIYEKLLQKIKKQQKASQKAAKKSQKSPKDNNDKKNENEAAREISKAISEHSNGGRGSGEDDSGSGSGAGNVKGQFDKHVYRGKEGEGDGSGDSSGKPHDKWGQAGIDKDFSPAVQKGMEESMRETIVAVAQQVERTKGELPSHVTKLIEGLMRPEINWKDVLAQFVTSTFGGERRWGPFSRRFIPRGLYLPAQRNPKINVAVAIDTSGSCAGDVDKFVSELVSLMRTFGKYTITVLKADADVQSVETYDGDQDDAIDTKLKEVTGFGGTSFKPVFKRLEADGTSPDCLIYFTDGYGDAPEKAPSYPVLWVLTKDHSEDFCKWGQKVVFKHSTNEAGF